METIEITLTIEITGKTEQEVRDHVADIQDEVEAMFEIDLKSSASIERVAIQPQRA